LDSDVLVDLLRDYPPANEWFATLPDDELVHVPGFVVMELIQGCRNKVEMERVQRLLANYGIVWLSPSDCGKALEVFAAFRLSHNAGLLDVLIGQTAIAMETPLLTFNQRHYEFIPGISTIQPYVKQNREGS
jgi:predicted nucleic acid-binding protein